MKVRFPGCDLVSYSGGLPTCVMRVERDQATHDAIIKAAMAFEDDSSAALVDYSRATQGLTASKRREVQEMF